MVVVDVVVDDVVDVVVVVVVVVVYVIVLPLVVVLWKMVMCITPVVFVTRQHTIVHHVVAKTQRYRIGYVRTPDC